VGLVGFCRTIAREGVKYNIKSNTIVPVCGRAASRREKADPRAQMFASAMTESVLPPDFLKGLKPELIAPFVGVLTAKNVSSNLRTPLPMSTLLMLVT